MGRRSIDTELILIVGYVMGIRSERRLCDEVHLNSAYRWLRRLCLDGYGDGTNFAWVIEEKGIEPHISASIERGARRWQSSTTHDLALSNRRRTGPTPVTCSVLVDNLSGSSRSFGGKAAQNSLVIRSRSGRRCPTRAGW